MKYSYIEEVGLQLSTNSYYVGGNWGFLLETHPDYKVISSNLGEDTIKVKKLQLSNGMLFVCNPQELDNLISIELKEFYTPEIKKIRESRVQDDIEELTNLFKRVYKNETPYLKKISDYDEVTLAIYSNNKYNKLIQNGIEYPAFRLTLQETFKVIRSLESYYNIYMKIEDKTKDISKFELLEKIMNNPKGQDLLYGGLEISLTKNGVFMTLRLKRK